MREKITHFEQVPLEEIQRHIAEGRIAKETLFDINSFETEFSSENLKYPQWQKPLQEAFLELNKDRFKQRIITAEFAIHKRMQNIAGDFQHNAERQALMDALSSLRVLKQDIN